MAAVTSLNIDIFSAAFRDNKLAWFKNDGNENFSRLAIPYKPHPSGTNSVHSSDCLLYTSDAADE